MGPSQVLPFRVAVELAVMAMKGYIQSPRTGTSRSASLVSYPDQSLNVFLTVCRDAVGVLYSPKPTGLMPEKE